MKMDKVVKFRKKIDKDSYEKIRDRYKKDFKDFVSKREENEKLIFIDTRKQM